MPPDIFALTHSESQCSIEAWARIDNAHELYPSLPADLQGFIDRQAAEQRHAAIILAMYLHFGVESVAKLVGDFSFAITDPNTAQLVLARDHMGVKPLYYTQIKSEQSGGLETLYAHTLPILEDKVNTRTQPKHSPFSQYCDEWLLAYLMNNSASWEKTPYSHVHKVAPAHFLVINSSGTVFKHQYFAFSPDADLKLSSSLEYVEAYQEVLTEAVRCRVNDSDLIGSELSGGLDSSTVTALASRTMQDAGSNLHGFGIIMGQYYGEAMAAVAQSSNLAATHFITQTQAHVMPDHLYSQLSGMPVEQANSVSHYPFYRLCQQLGVNVLLSGHGGDEFVTSEAPTVLVELWKNRDFAAFYKRTRGNLATKPAHMARWLYHYYRHGNQSITSRRLQATRAANYAHLPIKQSLLNQPGLKDEFMRAAKYDAHQSSQNGFALNNRWSPQLTSRLENGTLAASHFGVDYRWPLLDIRLLKLFLSIPATEKLGPGMVGRYLHRCAVAPILPSHIAWGPKELVRPHWTQHLLKSKKSMAELLSASNALPNTKATRHYEKMRQAQFEHVNHGASHDTSFTLSNPQKNQQELTVHPSLEELIDEEKLHTLLKQSQDSQSPSKARMAINHVNQFNRLNSFLTQRKSTIKT